MADLDELIRGMQFEALYERDPINTTNQPREEITFEFETSQPSDQWNTYSGWSLMTNAEKAEVKRAMDHFETFLNVNFREVFANADPDINVGLVSLSGNTAGLGGFNLSSFGDTITEYDSFALFDNRIDLTTDFNLIIHELGHAMGLKHPFEDPMVPAGTDSNKYTVMSYTENPDNGLNSDAMMLYDILALQDIWGAADYNTGNTRYTNKRTETVDAVWDTGGIDTFDASARGNNVRLDLREGAFSKFGSYDDVAITYGTEIENAIGGRGNDRITGNDGANRLEGGAGNDTMFGQNARDIMMGGTGNDRMIGGNGRDFLNGNAGRDTLISGSAKDRMKGGAGEDMFVYKENHKRDIIVDFTDDQDTINLRSWDFDTKAEALSYAIERNGNVIFRFDEVDQLVLLDTTKSVLADDLLV
ncbi:MAG: M10 family metallopeptidase [Pseudomonadota bacterium]